MNGANSNAPLLHGELADYSAAAMSAKAVALPQWRRRLDAIDTQGWPIEQQNDHKLVAAEMNGLDFNLRVLRPGARDPAFYVSVRPSRTDVPALLAQARVNLKDSNARDLWVFGEQELRDQSHDLQSLQAGTLTVSTLAGGQQAVATGFSAPLRQAIGAAQRATDELVRWLAHEAALEPQLGHFVPEEQRVFFTRITHREPNPSPIRRLASLSNLWDTRAEGFATAFEQLLYLRQPGYGTRYVTGKLLLDRLLAQCAHRQELTGQPFVLRDFLERFNREGMTPGDPPT